MKTKLVRILLLLPFLVMAMTFTSCDDVYVDVELDQNDIRYKTEYLCSRVWVDEWTDSYGVFHHQELTFDPDYIGDDYMYTEDRWGREESSYRFSWSWTNPSGTAIRMKYGPGDYSYMDNVVLRGNELRCVLDGESVRFVGR